MPDQTAEDVRLRVLGAGSGELDNRGGWLHGWSIRETSGTTQAVLRLRDGGDANGELSVSISLAAGESTRDWFDRGVRHVRGLFYELVSGTVEGAAFYRRYPPEAEQ